MLSIGPLTSVYWNNREVISFDSMVHNAVCQKNSCELSAKGVPSLSKIDVKGHLQGWNNKAYSKRDSARLGIPKSFLFLTSDNSRDVNESSLT